MAITSTSSMSSTSLAAASNPTVTTNQDRVRADIETKKRQLRAENEAARQAEQEVRNAEADYRKLSDKDKKKPEARQKYEAARIQAEDLKAQADRTRRELEKLLSVDLPQAIQNDNAATEANKARDKKNEELEETNKKNKAEGEAKANEEQAASSKPAAKGNNAAQNKTSKKATSEGQDVVGTAASGGDEAADADEAAKPAPKSGSVSEGDDYEQTPRQPAQTKGLYSSGNSVLPGEEEETRSGAPHREEAAQTSTPTPKPVVGSNGVVQTATPAASATPATHDGTPSTTVGSAPPPKMATDLVTEGGLSWNGLTTSQQAYILDAYRQARRAAKDGDVKKTMKSLLDAFFADIAHESGLADADPVEGALDAGKGQKQGEKPTVGAAGKNAAPAASTGTEAAAMPLQPGATGQTVGAAPKNTVQGLAAQPNTVAASGKSAGKSVTIGASGPTVGAAGDAAPTINLSSAPVTDGISRGYFGGMSPMELVQMVMLLAFQEASENVKDAAEMMQEQTAKKREIRGQMDAIRPDVTSYLASPNSQASNSAGGNAKTQMDSLQSQLDTIGDDNQILMIRLQNMTQLLTTMSQACSNISKTLSDATKSILGKIGN